MAEELKKLSLKVDYNEGWKDAIDDIKKDPDFSIDKLPAEFRDVYSNGDETTKDHVLHMYAIKRDVDGHGAAIGTPLVRKDSEGKDVVGVSYKVPVNGTDENGKDVNHGNINVVILGNGSVVFDDGFKDLFADYDVARTPEEKRKAESAIKAKMEAVANVLTSAGVEASSLRNIDGLSDDKKQILSEGLEKVVEEGRADNIMSHPYAGNSEDDEESRKLAEELQQQAEYLDRLEQDVKEGKASVEEFNAARTKFNTALSGLGVQKSWLGYKNCKSYTSVWGEKVWRIYPDANSMIDDGKVDKDGHVKPAYSVEVRLKRKKGKLCMSYGLPTGKLLDKSVMKAMLDSYKAAGYKVIALPNGRPGKEYGDWWDAMASKQMVPSGDKGPFPDPKDIREMIKTVTEKGVGDDKTVEWLETMLRECTKKAKATGNSDMYDVVEELSIKADNMKKNNEFHFSKTRRDKDGNKIGCFKLSLDDILKNIQTSKTSGTYRGKNFDAVDVIAAARAITEFTQKYWNGGSGGTMADLKGMVPDHLANANVPLTAVVTDGEKLAQVIDYMTMSKRKEVEGDIRAGLNEKNSTDRSLEKVIGDLTRKSVDAMKVELTNLSDEFGEKGEWNKLTQTSGDTRAAVNKFQNHDNNKTVPNHDNNKTVPIVSNKGISR